MTTWLPRRRTSRKPCCSRIWQTSRPERTRSLPTLRQELRYEDVSVPTFLHLFRIRRLQEEIDGFSQIVQSVFDGAALTCDIKLRAESDIDIVFLFNDGGEESLAFGSHVGKVWHDML